MSKEVSIDQLVPSRTKATLERITEVYYRHHQQRGHRFNAIYVDKGWAEREAETQDVLEFFTKIMPVSESELVTMFTQKEDGHSVLSNKFRAMMVGYFEMQQSLKARRIIRGKITHVTTRNGIPGVGLTHGLTEVFIPYSFYIDDEDDNLSTEQIKYLIKAGRSDVVNLYSKETPQEDLSERTQDYLKILSQTLGTTVKFIVEYFDPENRMALGNRISAMKKERYYGYIKPNQSIVSVGGQVATSRSVVSGTTVQANVLNVIPTIIFCEYMGATFLLPTTEIKDGFIKDATDFYKPGDTINVTLDTVLVDDNADEENPMVSIQKVHAARENDHFDYFSQLMTEGTKVVGRVSQIHEGNIFVRVNMDDLNHFNDSQNHKFKTKSFFDVVCKMPDYGVFPQKGMIAIVRITGQDNKFAEAGLTESRGFLGVLNHLFPAMT